MNSSNTIAYVFGGVMLFLAIVWLTKGLGTMLLLLVTMALGALTYVSYGMGGVDVTTGIFTAATIGSMFALRGWLKSKAKTPATAESATAGKKA